VACAQLRAIGHAVELAGTSSSPATSIPSPKKSGTLIRWQPWLLFTERLINGLSTQQSGSMLGPFC
jgi:hypothetical protein